MSVQTVCDGCGSRRVREHRGWRADQKFSHRVGRRVVHLAVTVLQSKVGRYCRTRRSGHKHVDLCRACLAKAIIMVAEGLKKRSGGK